MRQSRNAKEKFSPGEDIERRTMRLREARRRLEEQQENNRLTFEAAITSFLLTELDLAKTFIRIAKTDGKEKARRNRKNARKGYDEVIKLLPRTPLTRDEEAEIRERLDALRRDLQTLGETF